MKMRMKRKKKSRNLEIFWNKISNAFLQAIQNEQVKELIVEYRKSWNIHGHATTREELESQIRQMFLQDAGLVDGAILGGGEKIRRDGNKVFVTMKSDSGRATEWHWSNPFDLTDGGMILVPEWKERLIRILSNIDTLQDYSWIFEPRLFSREEVIIIPISHMAIDTLHKRTFLRRLRSDILNQLRLDYFLHWPLFFYYILTGDAKLAMSIGAFQFMPYRLFVIEDDYQESLLIKSYGNADSALLLDFVTANKEEIRKLNSLLNNPHASGRSLKEQVILMESKKVTKNRDLALMHESKNAVKNSDYLSALNKEGLRTGKVPSSYELKDNPLLKNIKPAMDRVKAYKSRAKKLSENITK